MPTEQEYQEAVAHPEQRQAFLNQLSPGRYVKKIQYDPKYSGDSTMQTVSGRFSGLLGTRPRVRVYSSAFSTSTHPTMEEFLSTLYDHEMFHARNIVNGSEFLRAFETENPELSRLQSELVAYQNQAANNFNGRRLRVAYKNRVERKITDLVAQIARYTQPAQQAQPANQPAPQQLPVPLPVPINPIQNQVNIVNQGPLPPALP